ASYRGKKVMAHAQGAEGVKQATLAGIHSIEHGIYLDEESIDLMLGHKTYLVPTLYAPVSILERMGEKSYIPDYAAKKTEEVVDEHQKSFQKAYKAGVKIAMGTDASVFKHGLNLKELTLMCNLGMTPMEAIVTSTKESAKCLGWEKDIGTIEAGKLADII